MSAGPLSARLLRALGGEAAPTEHDGEWRIRVDDVDRRFRDAIKAGGVPSQAPEGVGVGRCARVKDGETGAIVRIGAG